VGVLPSAFAEALRDRYAIERELGRGGMATVYLARDLKHKRPVALKVLSPDLSHSLGADRFTREIETAAGLQHPHVLPLHDSGEAAGLLWYTMPYVEGESLRDRLVREPQLPIEDALGIAREVADALAYAHQHGVVHRDVKPENILLSGGHALVADFGVAKALDQASGGHLTETGMAVGTPQYMAPEQAGGGPVDARSDVYALGCVLFEMLAGEPPFTGRTPQAVIAKRILEPVPHVRTLRESVPEPLEQAIARALAKVPADRFQTAAEFARALRGGAPTLAVTAAPAAAPPAVPAGGARRRGTRRAVALGLAALLALGAGAALLLWRSRTAPTALDVDLLAVAPFDVLDPKLQLWREGLVDLLSRNLDGAGPLRAVPPTTVIRRWSGRADELSAAELGRRTGARFALFGSLLSAGGDSARLRATLLDVETRRPLTELELRDEAGRVDRLGDSLAVRVLGELGRTRRIELTRVASLGSTSPPALKAFLQGEQFFRRAAWDSALANYERAVALDSNFALALWRLGRVFGWQRIGGESLSVVLALRAGSANRGLAPRDSLLVLVDSLFQASNADLSPTWAWYRRVRATAQEAVRRYPDDADAWHTLGEVDLHLGRQVPLRETLAAFDRAIELDSGYAPAYIHAIELAAALHGLEVARRYASEYLRRAPNDVTAEGIRLAFDLAEPARTNTPEVRRRLERASANVLLKAWLPVASAVDSGEVAVQVGRAFAATPESSAVWLPMAFRRAAYTLTLSYRGHLREAAAAWRPDLYHSSELLAELALLGAYPSDSAGAYFARWLGAGDLRLARNGLPWWAARGDAPAIERFRRLAESVARSNAEPALREEAVFGAEAARAYLILARGDTADALRRFETMPDSLCRPCDYLIMARQRLLATRGEDRRVLGDVERWVWYPTATEVSRALDGARAAERLGEREPAIRGYQFVVDAWRHADPELQPYVAEARRALGRLTSEPKP
jgi:serine/threonine-protein kinase